MNLYGDISKEILQFIDLWPGAVLKITPFRYQDILDKDIYIFVGEKNNRHVFIKRNSTYQKRYFLWPGTYKVQFINVS